MDVQKFQSRYRKFRNITRKTEIRNTRSRSSEEGEMANQEEVEIAENERETEAKSGK